MFDAILETLVENFPHAAMPQLPTIYMKALYLLTNLLNYCNVNSDFDLEKARILYPCTRTTYYYYYSYNCCCYLSKKFIIVVIITAAATATAATYKLKGMIVHSMLIMHL